MPTLEERVAALETQMTQIAGAGDYELAQPGETIDAILAGIRAAATYHGSETVTVGSGEAMAGATLSLGFSPTANTKIVGSVRRSGAPTPLTGVLLTFHYISVGSRSIYANLSHGGNDVQTTHNLPAGTYYIDWVCIDTGEGS